MDIKIKLVTIEERIRLQIEQALIKWVGDKMDAEDAKKKPKPYYRKGRWESCESRWYTLGSW